MFFRRFYDAQLAQASYLIGCQATGDAVVIDANRDIEQYVHAAHAEKLHIRYVTETHIHADFVSGSRELAAATGAQLLLSDEGGKDWRYTYATLDNAVLLKDGETFDVGNIRITALHTPGHTPEHLSFLVTDTPASDRPIGCCTGDFIFVGDVGRPDLLEKAAGHQGTMREAAHVLYKSLRKFADTQPDYLQIWPGHGAGSACGKALGAVPQTTLGYEKMVNPAFHQPNEERFVEWVLEGQPDPPTYFAQMKRVNRDGPQIRGKITLPPRFDAERLAGALERGAMVVDIRPTQQFAHGHIPGTINLPISKSFTTWAGWLVPYDRDVYLLFGAGQEDMVERAVRELASIGLDRVQGVFGPDVLDAWPSRSGGAPLEQIGQMTPQQLQQAIERDEVTVLDVRAMSEWLEGHLPGVANIPLGHLPERHDEIPTDKPVVLQCQGGSRSMIAASVLQAAGVKHVANLTGGFGAWAKAGLPVEHEEAAVKS